jgi:hypothetical protein
VSTSDDHLALERVRRAALLMLAALLSQFALGIAVNLYVSIPAHHPGARSNDYIAGSWQSLVWALHHAPAVLAAHTALGLLIVLTAAGLVLQTLRLRRRSRVAAATLGAAFVIGAGFNGASFLDYNKTTNSLIMALLFALAMLCYIAIIYELPAVRTPHSQHRRRR